MDKLKIVMDSGKEYIVEVDDYTAFLEAMHTEKELPMGGSIKMLKNGFNFIDDTRDVLINPSHISSIEIIER